MRINELWFQRSASHWAVSLHRGGSQQTAVSVSDMSIGKHAEFSQVSSGVVPTGVPFPFHNLAEESILHNPLISSLGSNPNHKKTHNSFVSKFHQQNYKVLPP